MLRERTPPDYIGHRTRLKERFLRQGDLIPDYELLELFLYLAQPRKDTKPLAKTLLKRFGSLGAIFGVPQEKLRALPQVGPHFIFIVRLFHEMMRRILQEELYESPIFDHMDKVTRYCRTCMQHLDFEQFRILFLNQKGMLIKDYLAQQGTLNHAHIYPREIVKLALDIGASSLILVHNHPSGDATPSSADIQITHRIKKALDPFDIRLLDHVIVSKFTCTSFKDKGWL